jgi:hypothetical protein
VIASYPASKQDMVFPIESTAAFAASICIAMEVICADLKLFTRSVIYIRKAHIWEYGDLVKGSYNDLSCLAPHWASHLV